MIYNCLVVKCVKLINESKEDEAILLYKSIVDELHIKFLY